tara:strand:- start:609 stop:839 length:231 start_codon:yes stop_codon:yes gene_type:complete
MRNIKKIDPTSAKADKTLPTYLRSKVEISMKISRMLLMNTRTYIRMLPKGNQWGFKELSSGSKKTLIEGNPGFVSG